MLLKAQIHVNNQAWTFLTFSSKTSSSSGLGFSHLQLKAIHILWPGLNQQIECAKCESDPDLLHQLVLCLRDEEK